MGRIKTQRIKRYTKELVDKYRDMFNENFDENKKAVEKVANIESKKIRNIIAGYVTRLVRKEEIL